MRSIEKQKKIFILVIIILLISLLGLIFLFNGRNINSIVKKDNNLEGDITFVSNRTDKRQEIQELINNFEKLHPKVKVNLELIGDAQAILQRKASIGELPDVTLIPSTISKTEYSNYFLALEDLGFSDDNLYNYYMGTGDDGNLYCLNTSITWQGVIYNKDIFKEANINKIPKTINELFDVCEKVKALNVTPLAINYRQQWTMDLWVDVIPHLIDNDLPINSTKGYNNILDSESGMYKSLNLVREIVKRGYAEKDLFNYDWQQFKNDMSSGKIAMAIWNSDFIYQMEDMGMNSDSIGIFPIPETKVIKIYGDYMYGVSKNSDNPEVAKAFLKYIFEENRYANAVNIMSPLKESSQTQKILKEMEQLDIPIITYTDYILQQSIEYASLENEYLNIKKELGLDAKFVQNFIIEDDIESLINNTNKKWIEKIKGNN